MDFRNLWVMNKQFLLYFSHNGDTDCYFIDDRAGSFLKNHCCYRNGLCHPQDGYRLVSPLFTGHCSVIKCRIGKNVPKWRVRPGCFFYCFLRAVTFRRNCRFCLSDDRKAAFTRSGNHTGLPGFTGWRDCLCRYFS